MTRSGVDEERLEADADPLLPSSVSELQSAGGALRSGVDEERLEADADPLLPSSVSELQSAGGAFKKRNIMTAMIALGIANVYMMRINLSVAAGPMQKHFGWSNAEEGVVLGSFFAGYIPSQIPGGYMASRYGGKLVFGIGILGTAVMTLLLPRCAMYSTGLLYAARILTGVFEGVTFPAMNVMFTHWVPHTERSLRVAIMASGAAYAGNAVALPLSGYIVSYAKETLPGYDDPVSTSWPWVFYVFGCVGLAWFVLWLWLAADTPETHSTIDERELTYLRRTTGAAAAHDETDTRDGVSATDERGAAELVVKSKSAPWKGFLFTPGAWVVYLCHFGHNFVLYLGMTYIPKYLSEQLSFDIKSAGGIAVLPYLFQFCLAFMAGVFSDGLVAKRGWKIRNVRVLVTVLGVSLCATFLCITGWIKDTALAVASMTCAVGFSGWLASGYNCSYLDLSPHYCGQFFSVGNVLANFAGLLAPIAAGQLLNDDQSSPSNGTASNVHVGDDIVSEAADWRNVFYMAAGVYLLAGLQYCLFISGKPLQALN